MHTCAEVISLDDAEALCKLIKLFITSPEVERAVKEMSEND
jgi:putative aminopeptidase FrvX